METSWCHPRGIVRTPAAAPPFTHLKHAAKTQDGGPLRPSRVLLCQLELHAGAADGKPSRRG